MDTPPPAVPDADALLRRFRLTRHPDDFSALFDGTAPSLFKVAVRLTRDGAAAEDVLQETFLAVLKGVGSYDPDRAALPWLTGVLERKAADSFRRRERDRRPLPRPEDDHPEPDEEAEKHELKAEVRSAIEDLDEPFRRVAVLRWRYGLAPGEIADALGENPGTVRSNLFRAKQRLERRLNPALLFPILAIPTSRGFEAIRAEILSEAASFLAPATAATTAITAGGVLMAKKVFVTTLAVLLLLSGVGVLLVRRDGSNPPPDAPTDAPDGLKSPVTGLNEASESGADVGRSEELPPPVDLDACNRDEDLFGTTVDDDGQPVPGARVVAIRYPWRRSSLAPAGLSYLEEEGVGTRSTIDGTFVLHLSRGDQVDLRATADGYGPGEQTRCLAGERVTLVLRRRGPSLVVRCLDESGQVAPGVRLKFMKRAGTSVYGALEFRRNGVTDEDGQCTFAHLTPGQALVMVDHPDLGNQIWLQREIPAEGILPLEVVLPQGRTVSGLVTDAVTGEGLRGARIGSNWTMQRPVTSADNGHYSFTGWTGKGTSVLRAAANGYASEILKVPESGDLDFVLEPAFAATGRVIDAAGRPVAGVRVSASGSWNEGERKGMDRSADTTDGDGKFTLENLSCRASHRGVAEARGHGRTPFEFEPPPAGEPDLDLGDLELTVSRSIEGRALGPDGEPLAGCDVNLSRLKAPDPARGRDPRRRGAVSGMGEVRCTDDLGRFRFPDLSPGRWGLKLVLPGAPIVETVVELTADRDVLDVVLEQEGRSLTFLVTDPEGNPLPKIMIMSAMVFPHPTSGIRGTTSIQAETDAQGRAEFRSVPNVARGRAKGVVYQVQPYTGENSPAWATYRTEPIVAEGQVVTVVLEPAAWIRGRVLDLDGNPVPGLYVGAHGPDPNARAQYIATCDESGAFAVRVPTGQTVRLLVQGSRSVRRAGNAVAAEQTAYRGELPGVSSPRSGVLIRVSKLSEGQTLSILVVDPDGAPVADFPIYVSGLGANAPGGMRTETSGADGRFHLTDLFGDTLSLRPSTVVPEGMPEEEIPPAPVEVVPSGQEVVLSFRRGIALAGRVLHSSGSPAANTIVICNVKNFGGRSMRTDEKGRFTFWLGPEQVADLTATWGDGSGGIYQCRLEARPGQGELEMRLTRLEGR